MPTLYLINNTKLRCTAQVWTVGGGFQVNGDIVIQPDKTGSIGLGYVWYDIWFYFEGKKKGWVQRGYVTTTCLLREHQQLVVQYSDG